MEHIESFQRRNGVDIGYGPEMDLHPSDGEGRVGKSGIDKTFTLSKMIELAYRTEPRPNIIIKGGPRAKWYLKRFQPNEIESGIEKQRWRDNTRATMWVIKWNE
jgi:hypothetical protein|tara:strand:- start:2883 stop:3194 length:312 start_codon:yes stop_codon:yes gene_type:complete